MYFDYFGLKEAPFSIAPNPEYLFMTERHQEALAHLYHGIKSDAGFVLLTGDIGTGKTTICRSFLSELPDNVVVAFILNPFLGGRELLMTICEELAIDDFDKKASLRSLTQIIHKRLLENYAKGLTTILLIDEAQHINLKVLELIRLLTNLETNQQKLFKIILVGQPELNDHIAKRELVQLAQRITARYHIGSLNPNEISAYINYRMGIAGSMDGANIFPPSIMKTLYNMTGGVPRVINALCDRALLGVYSQNKRQVDKKILKIAQTEISGPNKKQPLAPPLRWAILGLVIIGVAFGSWFLSGQYYSAQQQAPQIAADLSESPSSQSSTIPPSDTAPIDSTGVESTPDSIATEATPPRFQQSYLSKDDAMDQLIRGLFIPTNQAISGCDDIVSFDWRCETLTEVTWDEFITINRPAVVTLRDGDERFNIVVLRKAAERLGILYDEQITWIDAEKIQLLWDEQLVFLWQPPQNFVDYIYFDSGPELINWLANAFTIIDDQQQPLASNQFNSLLKQRVSLFQEENQLNVDGIVGRDTILRINEALGIAKVLERQASDSLAIQTLE